MKKLIAVVCLFFILVAGAYPAIAQDCPPSSGDPGWEVIETVTLGENSLEKIGEISDVKIREFSDGFEVIVDWSKLNKYKAYLTDNELRQMMYKAIIVDILSTGCTFPSQEFIFYEETPCIVKKRCYLKLYYDTYIECQDDCWTGPDMTVYEKDGSKYYKVEYEEVCDVQCCLYQYSVMCNYIEGIGLAGVDILNIIKYPFDECEDGDTDCLNDDLIPCNSNCEIIN